jgi:hypothetical protein
VLSKLEAHFLLLDPMASFCWNSLPEAVAIISTENFRIQAANKKFERAIAPLARLSELDFLENIIGQEDKQRFKLALRRLSELPSSENGCVACPMIDDIPLPCYCPAGRALDLPAMRHTQGHALHHRLVAILSH